MANNYQQFSETLEINTAEELAWWKSQLDEVIVDEFGSIVSEASDTTATAPRFMALGRQAGVFSDQEDLSTPGFDWEFLGSVAQQSASLWVYAEESGELERLAYVVSEFLKSFHPDEFWSLTYAATCSKPCAGEFGGGAVFVTAARIQWTNAHDWAEERAMEFDAAQVARRARGA